MLFIKVSKIITQSLNCASSATGGWGVLGLAVNCHRMSFVGRQAPHDNTHLDAAL